jgi:hypothetical protein
MTRAEMRKTAEQILAYYEPDEPRYGKGNMANRDLCADYVLAKCVLQLLDELGK